MEVTIYEVWLEIECKQTDMDYCSYWGWEDEYKDAFSTKQSAIRACQSKFAKQPTNDYVRSVHAAVYKVVITDKGRETVTRIYNKFKKR